MTLADNLFYEKNVEDNGIYLPGNPHINEKSYMKLFLLNHFFGEQTNTMNSGDLAYHAKSLVIALHKWARHLI